MAAPTPESPSILKRLERLRWLRNVRLALNIMNIQPEVQENLTENPTAYEYQVDVGEGGSGPKSSSESVGGGGGSGVRTESKPRNLPNFIDAKNPSQASQTAYDLQAAQRAARDNAAFSTNIPPNIAPGTNPESAISARNTPESEHADAQTQKYAFDQQVQQMKAAQDMRQNSTGTELMENAPRAVDAVDEVAATAISKYTDVLWITWMWASIPAILVDFGISFTLATIASWVSLFKTLQGPLLEKMLKKSMVAALPPAFSFLPGLVGPETKNLSGLLQMFKIGAGLNAFGFFITAHIVWALLTAILVAVLIAVYFTIAPYIEAGSFVCSILDIHPLCQMVL